MRYLIILLLLTGCTQAPAYEPDRDEAAAIVAGQIAFYQPAETGKPDIQTTCKECKGTKKVKSGDGLAMVPCSCGENCKCQRTEEPPKVADSRPEVRFYTTDDCYFCELFKQNMHLAPFVRFVEYPAPEWVEGFPTLHWVGDDGEEYQLASGDINEFKRKFQQRNPSQYQGEAVQEAPQVQYYYEPTRRGRRFLSGCSSGRCR
jgi:hypothetical protein